MLTPMPHEEGWELAPENAHPRARALLWEDYFWDCGDDNSPWGSDDGADALSHYSRAHGEGENGPDPILFLEDLMKWQGISLEPWPLPENATRSEVAIASVAHHYVIGVAFGMYLIHGSIDPVLRELGIEMVQRELTPAHLEKWHVNYRAERDQRLQVWVERLDAMEALY